MHCVGHSACIWDSGSRQLRFLPPTIQLHPVFVAQHRLALLVKLPFIRDGGQGMPELTVGFGGAPKGRQLLARKEGS